MEKAMHTLEMLAQEKSDGHFTIMKFTTDWAVALFTISDPDDIEHMHHGETLEAAVCRLIRNMRYTED